MVRVVVAQLLAVQLVASVHRRRVRELVFADGRERIATRLAHAYARRHLSATTAKHLELIDDIIAPDATRAHLIAALAAATRSSAT